MSEQPAKFRTILGLVVAIAGACVFISCMMDSPARYRNGQEGGPTI
jgi:hypothetical protein